MQLIHSMEEIKKIKQMNLEDLKELSKALSDDIDRINKFRKKAITEYVKRINILEGMAIEKGIIIHNHKTIDFHGSYHLIYSDIDNMRFAQYSDGETKAIVYLTLILYNALMDSLIYMIYKLRTNIENVELFEAYVINKEIQKNYDTYIK